MLMQTYPVKHRLPIKLILTQVALSILHGVYTGLQGIALIRLQEGLIHFVISSRLCHVQPFHRVLSTWPNPLDTLVNLVKSMIYRRITIGYQQSWTPMDTQLCQTSNQCWWVRSRVGHQLRMQLLSLALWKTTQYHQPQTLVTRTLPVITTMLKWIR